MAMQWMVGTGRPAQRRQWGDLEETQAPSSEMLLLSGPQGPPGTVFPRTVCLLELALGSEEVGLKIEHDVVERGPRCCGSHKAS